MKRAPWLAAAIALQGCYYDFDRFDPDAPDAPFAETFGGDTGTAASDGSIDAPSDVANDTGVAETAPDTSVAMDAAAPCTEPAAATFGGHCYFGVGAKNWSNAKTDCESRGAHLVTITSAEEEAVVEGIHAGKDRWMGLSRPASAPSAPASFAWVTGEAVSFRKWGAGEPNGTGIAAGLRGTNDWGDFDPKTSLDEICERD